MKKITVPSIYFMTYVFSNKNLKEIVFEIKIKFSSGALSSRRFIPQTSRIIYIYSLYKYIENDLAWKCCEHQVLIVTDAIMIDQHNLMYFSVTILRHFLVVIDRTTMSNNKIIPCVVFSALNVNTKTC